MSESTAPQQTVDEFLAAFEPKLAALEPAPAREATTTASDSDEEHTDAADPTEDGDAADPSDSDEQDGSDADDATEADADSDEDPADADPDASEDDAVGEDDDEPIDPSFEDAAQKHGLSTEFEDALALIPDEAARRAARQAFKKKLAAMESGYTKVQQEATSFRQERKVWEAERAYVEGNPGKAFVHAYQKLTQAERDALLDEVNDEVVKIDGTPGYDKVVARDFDESVKTAGDTVREQIKQAEARDARGKHVAGYVYSAAKKAGVPVDATGIVDAVLATIHARRTFAPGSGDEVPGDISEEEIDTIVAQKAKLWRQRTGYVKRSTRREYNKEKVQTRKQAPKVAPGQGNAALPAKRVPSNASIDEKMLATADRLFPD